MLPELEINTPQDIYEALEHYNAREKGIGLMRILEAVRNSKTLPEEWREKFLGQFGHGLIVPKSFKTEVNDRSFRSRMETTGM
jgi:hypothetical protein